MDQTLKALLERCMALPDGAPLTHDDLMALRECASRFPAATLPAVLLLRHAGASLSDDEAAALKARVALGASDRRTEAFARHGDRWADFYPAEKAPAAKQTNDVIDTFLRTYGSCTPEEEKLLERMIFNPAASYAEMLAREEQENLPPENSAEPDEQTARINAFIRTQHPAAQPVGLMPDDSPAEEEDDEKPKAPIPHPEHTDDTLLSESLAKIFIKQGRYERAYEIISGLNLKFPKKSAYFADQLRFLQKLIINRRRLQELEDRNGATEK